MRSSIWRLFQVLTPWLKYFAWWAVNIQSVSCGARLSWPGDPMSSVETPRVVVNFSSPKMSDIIVCAACNENIVGKAMKAKNNCFHEHHFVCSQGGCGINLVKLPVYTKYKGYIWPLNCSNLHFFRDGCLYCQTHYQEKFCSKCFKCEDYITGVKITANILVIALRLLLKCSALCEGHGPELAPWALPMLRLSRGVHWQHVLQGEGETVPHPDTSNVWPLQDTRPYCEHCYQDTVLPKCGGCRWDDR